MSLMLRKNKSGRLRDFLKGISDHDILRLWSFVTYVCIYFPSAPKEAPKAVAQGGAPRTCEDHRECWVAGDGGEETK